MYGVLVKPIGDGKQEMGGNGKWYTWKWEYTLFLNEERCLSLLESVSEEVVTALLELYIQQICKLLQSTTIHVTNNLYSF